MQARSSALVKPRGSRPRAHSKAPGYGDPTSAWQQPIHDRGGVHFVQGFQADGTIVAQALGAQQASVG